MGQLHFIGGEKGGVGKSMTSRLLAQYFIDQEQPFIGYDTDTSHRTFSRFYDQFSLPINTNEASSLDKIIDAVEESPDNNIIVDLAAQTTNNLINWINDCDLSSILAELYTEMYIWHVMDDGADSSFLLNKLLDELPSHNCRLIVVQNLGRARNFSLFEESEIYKKALKRHANFIKLSILNYDLAQKIDFNNLSFWAAANNRQLMKVAERHRVKTWLGHNYEQIAQALELQNQEHLKDTSTPLFLAQTEHD